MRGYIVYRASADHTYRLWHRTGVLFGLSESVCVCERDRIVVNVFLGQLWVRMADALSGMKRTTDQIGLTIRLY